LAVVAEEPLLLALVPLVPVAVYASDATEVGVGEPTTECVDVSGVVTRVWTIRGAETNDGRPAWW
jgi:hypothetical protein